MPKQEFGVAAHQALPVKGAATAGGGDLWRPQVFEDSKNLVRSAVDGYNVCIFAYGQTGSGAPPSPPPPPPHPTPPQMFCPLT